MAHFPNSTAARIIHRGDTYSQFGDFTIDWKNDFGQSHRKLLQFCDDGSFTQEQDNGDDDQDDDGSTTDSDVLGDPEGNADPQSAEASVETYIQRKMYSHFRCLPDLEGIIFSVRCASRIAALELFGEHREINAVIADKQLPAPQSVLDLCQGQMSKYIALASALDVSAPAASDIGMDVAEAPIQSHPLYSSRKNIYFFRVLHASPAAVEIQEVDMGQQQFTSEHMVVELLNAVCPGLEASTLLASSGSVHRMNMKTLIARTTHHVRWTAQCCTHMVHPLRCDQQLESEAFFSLAHTLGDLYKASESSAGVINSQLILVY